MNLLWLAPSVLLITLVLLDGFESMILPRRVARKIRIARLFYRFSWEPWAAIARRIRGRNPRNLWLAWYGPLALLVLFAIWAGGLVLGFAGVHYALGTPLQFNNGGLDFAADLYFSGVTFFTLGYGDVTPMEPVGRAISVFEAGLGFAFLAIIIGYLPTLYQTFSRREVMISLLDARAGSPPSGSQVLARMARAGNLAALDGFFADWEKWCSELLESTMSYPAIAFYRSQHDNQSWLAALAAVLDASALAIANTTGGTNSYQAQVTFAMARHAAVDLAMLFYIAPDFHTLRDRGAPCLETVSTEKLDELRGMYEPYLNGLSQRFLMPLPAWKSDSSIADNWQSSAGMKKIIGLDHLGDPVRRPVQGNDHFDFD